MTTKYTLPTAACFPGVGVKPCGAEHRFFNEFQDIFTPWFETASDFCHYDLRTLFDQGKISKLDSDINQSFTITFSCAAYAAFTSLGSTPELLGAYSFGIYPALVSASAISFLDALRISHTAFGLMSHASKGMRYGMGIVIGLKTTELFSFFSPDQYPDVRRTNTNNDTCTIFSGPHDQLEKLLETARRHDAIGAEFLGVDIPYHHPVLKEGVAVPFARELDQIRWSEPAIPIISSIDQRILTTVEDLKKFTLENLFTPISWEQVVRALWRNGMRTVLECGPGISLAQNGRFMEFPLTWCTIKSYRHKMGIQ